MRQSIALVTGATGYIGANLCAYLLQHNWTVHVLVRGTSDTTYLQSVAGENVYLHQVEEDGRNIPAVVAQAKPEVVFHVASLFLAEHKYENISELIQSNVTFGTQLADAMVKQGCTKFINVGTAWQHYNDSIYDPVCLYAATKEAFEAILTYYKNAHSLQVITLKLFDTYGPKDPRRKLLALLSDVALTGKELVMSAGEQKIDLVYIDDVMHAFGCAIQQFDEEQEGTYAIASGRSVSLRELVAIMEKVTRQKLNISWGGRPYRQREVMVPWTQGCALPGWKAQVPLEVGLKKLLNDAGIV